MYSWDGISALNFHQCFDNVGSLTGRVCHLSSKVLFWNKWWKKFVSNQLNQVSLEMAIKVRVMIDWDTQPRFILASIFGGWGIYTYVNNTGFQLPGTYACICGCVCCSKSFMLSTLGFTCVAFVAGALALWAPKYMSKSLMVNQVHSNDNSWVTLAASHHTHTTISWPSWNFVWDYLGEPAPER